MLREVHDDEMHFRLSISKDLGQTFNTFAQESKCDLAEVLRKALFLYSIAVKANQAGNQIVIVSKSDEVLQRIVGVASKSVGLSAV